MRNNMHFGGEKNDNLDSNSMGFHIKNTLMNGDIVGLVLCARIRDLLLCDSILKQTECVKIIIITRIMRNVVV